MAWNRVLFSYLQGNKLSSHWNLIVKYEKKMRFIFTNFAVLSQKILNCSDDPNTLIELITPCGAVQNYMTKICTILVFSYLSQNEILNTQFLFLWQARMELILHLKIDHLRMGLRVTGCPHHWGTVDKLKYALVVYPQFQGYKHYKLFLFSFNLKFYPFIRIDRVSIGTLSKSQNYFW